MREHTILLCLAACCLLVCGCPTPPDGQTPDAPAGQLDPAPKKLGPHELDGEGFITNWLIVGPFPNPGERPNNKGFHVDYLSKYGGEIKYVPAEGRAVVVDAKTTVKWGRYVSDGRTIRFMDVTHIGLDWNLDDILTYSACWIECDKDTDVQIRIGSDDGYKLWIDHKLVGSEHVYRSPEVDQETYPMKLSKGMHLILIKVDQDYGSFEFMLRVVTPEGKKAPGVKVWN
ncbi:hypothetical protein LCGC14_2001510 [marine sediment metagenome]|uniref:PA14 domain-containing protein n=1 Tax=marine sediment metagenome TaxID=412755 RepID=A0A0F9I082_9ZZZZ